MTTIRNTIIKFTTVKYKDLKDIYSDKILPAGNICFITELPWYKSWFGLRPTRMVLGDGETKVIKLKFI